jgi:hypothetical protein
MMLSTLHQGEAAPARRMKFSEMQAKKLGGRRGGLEPIELGIQPPEPAGGAMLPPTDYGRSFRASGMTTTEAMPSLPTAGDDTGPDLAPEWANW